MTKLSTQEKMNTLLTNAVKANNIEGAKLALAKGADINTFDDEDGDTPLHLAAWYGYEEITKLLLEERADVNASNEYGVTSLYWACKRGNSEIADLLKQHGGMA